jgi:hypothetical protein
MAHNEVGRGAEVEPPVLNNAGVWDVTPQKEIFAKVRSGNMQLDLQLYCMCCKSHSINANDVIFRALYTVGEKNTGK